MFFCDTWNHAWKTGWKVYVSAYEPSEANVKDVFEVLKVLK